MSGLPRRRVAHLHVLSTLSLIRAGMAARGPTEQRHQDRSCFAAAPFLPLIQNSRRGSHQRMDLGPRRHPELQKQLRIAPSGIFGERRALATAVRGPNPPRQVPGKLSPREWIP